jgi:hypothetical protein
MKIKINIKPKDLPAELNETPESVIDLSHLKKIQIQPIVPYEESDEDDENDLIQPKVSTKIKINFKPASPEQEETLPSDAPDGLSIEPKIVLKKQKPPTQKVFKINIKKKSSPGTSYKNNIIHQKPVKKKGITYTLLAELNIETFYEDGRYYFINWETGYIFPPDSHKMDNAPEPIGQLTDTEWTSEDFKDKDNFHPLMKRKITWFYYFDLDAEVS